MGAGGKDTPACRNICAKDSGVQARRDHRVALFVFLRVFFVTFVFLLLALIPLEKIHKQRRSNRCRDGSDGNL